MKGAQMSEGMVVNEPALIRAMRNQDEFTAQAVQAWGADRGPVEAQRLMGRAERNHGEDIKIMRLMMPEVMRVFREELKGLVA
jgi:hypothetical protein